MPAVVWPTLLLDGADRDDHRWRQMVKTNSTGTGNNVENRPAHDVRLCNSMRLTIARTKPISGVAGIVGTSCMTRESPRYNGTSRPCPHNRHTNRGAAFSRQSDLKMGCSSQASSGFNTSPSTSVRRKSRPWKRKVNRSWSIPKRCKIVA